ncbi:MAG: hypothetical protein FVQ82_02405 [Planctomycetes bacterium]|nr:hypothetical protein [Planctomycetota bacterium]
MYNLVLDSQVFISSFGRYDSAFLALERLCKKEVIKLHVPNLVKEEFVTHYAIDKKNILNKSLKNIRELDKSHFKEFLNLSNTISTLTEAKAGMEEYLRAKFVIWLQEMNASESCVSEADSKSVFEGYFKGNPPFKNIKTRKDIPDAFIYENIKNLSEITLSLYFVSGDKKLRETVGQLQNADAYETLNEVIVTIINEVDEHSLVHTHLPEIIKALKANENDLIGKISDEGERLLEAKEIELCDEYVENGEATIWQTGTPENIKLQFDELENYGDGMLLLPFDFQAECLVDFYIFKSDYYCLDDDIRDHVSVEDWNKHYFRAEKYENISFSGGLMIDLSALEIENCDDLNNLQDTITTDDMDIDDNFEIKVDM